MIMLSLLKIMSKTYDNNWKMVPYIIGEFLGCPLVIDEDQIIKEAQEGTEENDYLENFDVATDTICLNMEEGPIDSAVTEPLAIHEPCHVHELQKAKQPQQTLISANIVASLIPTEALWTGNTFSTLCSIKNEDAALIVVQSPSHQKWKKDKAHVSPHKHKSLTKHIVAIGLSTPSANNVQHVDEWRV